jgi:glycosyltransferase involved in cell wall biosynthesis
MHGHLFEFPLVSAVVPAYNAQKYIGATLQSLVFQSYSNLEIIVADDGSSDQTVQIVKKWMAKDQRIKLVRQSNLGVGAARNLAIQASRGSFIAPVDADDICYPDKIAKLLDCLQKTGDQVGLAYSWSAIIDHDGNLTGAAMKPEFEGDVFEDLLFSNFLGNASVCLIRKQCFDKVGLYKANFFAQQAQGCEDYDLSLRIAEHFEFKVIKECLTGYRKTDAAMSTDHRLMERSQNLVFKDQKIKNPWIPDIIFDWSMAYYCLWLSRAAVRKKNFYHAIRYLCKAALCDPMLLQTSFYWSMYRNCFRKCIKNIKEHVSVNRSKAQFKILHHQSDISIRDLELKAQSPSKKTSFDVLKEKRLRTVHKLFRQARIKNGHYLKSSPSHRGELFRSFKHGE